ncbi:uncharacterized protein L201_003434 [Kwoniella dendrophila CBS 6074]|uniref:RNase III domain-containing protein n=1 Tax=Kwoniella dendrophila CBS 6074 TaxID=1295534 RepID=A0AAX4JUQ1_9TREE
MSSSTGTAFGYHPLDTFVLPPIPFLRLPPLPPVTNPKLKEMVFTHVSCNEIPRNYHMSVLLLDNQGGVDYEKLEHVGDALLETIAVTLAHELYPNFRQGIASTLRRLIVSNVTLSQISQQYGLHRHIRSRPDVEHTLKNSQRTQASIFEAYIAAVYYSLLDLQYDDIINRSTENKEKHTSWNEPFLLSCRFPGEAGISSSDKTYQDEEYDCQDNDAFSDFEAYKDSNCENNNSRGIHNRVGNLSNPFKALSFEKEEHGTRIQASKIKTALPQRAPSPLKGILKATVNPTIPSNVGSGNNKSASRLKLSRNRGEAFSQLFDWLSEIFQPIIHFAVQELEKEELRLISLQPESRKILKRFVEPPEWKVEDSKSKGGKQTLHAYLGNEYLPKYSDARIEGNYILSPWKVECQVIDKNGKQWSSEATRMTKQAAANVAGWKMCLAMGIIDEDD